MRTIFIWDIHWCFEEFKELLEKINYDENKDKLYLTWDLINKWPKSFEVTDFLLKNPQIKSVIWNNEINFLRFLEQGYEKYNPLFDEFKENFKQEHIDYIKNLPLYIETQDWILLHGWVMPWKKLEEHSIDEITKIRKIDWKNWYEYYNWTKPIIYWHYAADWLRIRKNTIGLDSWCVYWKRLTAYIFETWEIFQESAKQQYVKIF